MDKLLNTTGLILCTCEGKIPTNIDLEAIEASLKKKKIQVVRADKLCEDWTPLENLAGQSKQSRQIETQNLKQLPPCQKCYVFYL